MKIYPSVDTETTIQNHGSRWVIILRGKGENLRNTFNGLYNWGATNSTKLAFTDHTKQTAFFWSNEDRMHRFFYNQYLGEDAKGGNEFADRKLKEIKETHEQFFKFDNVQFADAFVDGYEVGTI